MSEPVPIILLGAGLASSLIALRLAQRCPGLPVLVLERDAALAARHTWSFHETDVPATSLAWLRPLLRHSWTSQEVRFPGHRRRLATPYHSLDDLSLRAALDREPAIRVLHGCTVAEAGADRVVLADGRSWSARCVIDGRGQAPSPHLVLAWQKFLGLVLWLPRPHGLEHPVIMDATVRQEDGYRFLYCLPFTPDALLVEDTRYADGPALDHAEVAEAVQAYAAAQGWSGAVEIGRESGVLPIALAFDAPALWRATRDGPVPVGLRAGLFHPVTGYSLPEAAAVAERVAETAETALASGTPMTTALVRDAVRDYALARAQEQAFLRLLSRMLFRACAPERRYRVLERFYRLPAPLIERFYAGHLRTRDKLRLLLGKPPVPVHRALRCIGERRLLEAASG